MCSIKNSALGMLPLPHEPQVHWECRHPKDLCWAFPLPPGDGKSRAEMPAGAAGQGSAPSAAQAVLYLLHRSARTGRSSEESFREIDGEREKTHYKTPHLII